jgi:nicotinamidase-related amidase
MTQIDLPARNYRLFPAVAPLGETDHAMALDLGKVALLLIDVYHAADDPTASELVHSVWDEEFRNIVENRLGPLVQSARCIGIPVVYAMNSAPRIGLSRSPYGWYFRESLGFDPERDFAEPEVDPLEFWRGQAVQLVIPEAVTPQPGDFYIRKHTYNGFFETRLESVLRNLGIQTLLCAGFATDCCVLFTVADAVFRGFQTILIRDCTLASELPDEIDTFARTRRTVSSIESFLGPSTTSGDVMTVLSSAAANGVRS